MKIGRKFFSILLAACLLFSLMPFAALDISASDTAGTVSYGAKWSESQTDTIELTVTPENGGTVYYLVADSEDAAPSQDEVIANGTSKECTGNADNGITISGQSESDSKNIYLVYQDAGEEEYYAMSILELPAKSSGSEVKNYGIQIDPYDPSFGEAATGYTEAPAAKTITIKNTGNAALTLALGSAEGYAASLSSTELAVDSSVTLTVQPNTGLEKGTHKASITLTASADSEQILNTSLPFTFTVSDNPTPSEGTVSFEASRSGSQNLSLTFTPTVDGTLRYIVKDKGDSAPLEADFDNANSISGTEIRRQPPQFLWGIIRKMRRFYICAITPNLITTW